MSFCNLTCTCGHTADIEEFTRTPLGAIPDRRTPREVLQGIKGASFQCPKCNVAWHVEKTPIRVHRFTFQGQPEVRLITEPNKIVRENSYL